MAEAVGDDLGVFAPGDQQRHWGASERVGTEVLIETGCIECGLPDASHPRGSSDGCAMWRGEDPRLRIRVLEWGDVLDDLVGDCPGEDHGSDALRRHRWSDEYPSLDTGCGSAESDLVAERVDFAELETGELSDAKAAEGTDQDEASLARVKRVGDCMTSSTMRAADSKSSIRGSGTSRARERSMRQSLTARRNAPDAIWKAFWIVAGALSAAARSATLGLEGGRLGATSNVLCSRHRSWALVKYAWGLRVAGCALPMSCDRQRLR